MRARRKVELPYGWAGEILHVDLTKGKVKKEPTTRYSKDYIGGRGINAKLLYDAVKPGISAFDPENLLAFGTGVLTGTPAPSSSRMEITSKSPLTGLQGMASIGGFFGPELKFAGYDCIAVKGKATKPVYIYIENERVEIKDASGLWGKDTVETQTSIRKDLADDEIQIVSIGLGGENLVRFASVVHDLGDAAGRTGLGAVMGSKNLKAVAVRGTKGLKIAKPKELLQLYEKLLSRFKEGPIWNEWKTSAPALARARQHEDKKLEVRRGQTSHEKALREFPDLYMASSAELIGNQEGFAWEDATTGHRRLPFVKKHKVRDRACFNCFRGCMRFINLPGVGVCLQSCQGFAEPWPALKLREQKEGFQISRLCELYGIDIISTVHSIATMMDLYERGIISEKDTGGVPFKWGDVNACIEMTHKIAKREGIGDILAEGVARSTRKIGRGAENYAMHTKGLEHYVYDLRGWRGRALSTAVSPRIMRGLPMEYMYRFRFDSSPEILEEICNYAEENAGTRKAFTPHEYEGKPAAVVHMEREVAVADLMGICRWITVWLGFPHDGSLTSSELVELFRVCTGTNMDKKDVLRVAERTFNLERAFNVREGLTRKDDTLPKKYFKEPLPDGFYKGEVLDKEKFEQMKDEYYRLRGWDVKTGVPTVQKLEALDLKSVSKELKELKKIKKNA